MVVLFVVDKGDFEKVKVVMSCVWIQFSSVRFASCRATACWNLSAMSNFVQPLYDEPNDDDDDDAKF